MRDLHVQLHVPLVHDEAQRRILAARRQPGEQAIDVARNRRDRLPLRRRRPLGEQSRRLGLERLAQFIELADVGVGGHAHARPGAGPGLEQAVFLQPAQRIGDGRTLMPSSRATRRRDTGVPGGSWPRRISSRMAE